MTTVLIIFFAGLALWYRLQVNRLQGIIDFLTGEIERITKKPFDPMPLFQSEIRSKKQRGKVFGTFEITDTTE